MSKYHKLPQCGYMEPELKYIAFYVKKQMAHHAVCYNFPLVRDRQLGMPAFMRLVYFNTGNTFEVNYNPYYIFSYEKID